MPLDQPGDVPENLKMLQVLEAEAAGVDDDARLDPDSMRGRRYTYFPKSKVEYALYTPNRIESP